MMLAVVAAVVFIERAQRRLLIQYPKRQMGNKMSRRATSSHLPLKLNSSGVIPPIFASSLLLLPITAAQFAARVLARNGSRMAWSRCSDTASRLYLAIYVALILFFAFFYTAVVFNPTRNG